MDGCLLSHQGIVAELSNGVRPRSGRGGNLNNVFLYNLFQADP